MGFFGGGASVDLASPPAIGNTTPNTGAFTTLSISNNGLSNNLPFLFSGSGGAYAGLYYASPAVVVAHYYNPQIALDENALVRVKSGGAFCFSNSSSPLGLLDTYIYRDSGGVIAQRNSTNAQTFRLYNTFTDASNYERGFLRWAANEFEIGSERAGTGTQRSVSILGGDNNSAIKFTANSLCAIFGNNSNTFYKIIQLEAGLRYSGNDAGLFRNAAGVVEVNNGTAGTFRDLIVRNFRMSAPTGVPTANNSTGTEGSIRWDADYIYICTATNTWKRVAIATW